MLKLRFLVLVFLVAPAFGDLSGAVDKVVKEAAVKVENSIAKAEEEKLDGHEPTTAEIVVTARELQPGPQAEASKAADTLDQAINDLEKDGDSFEDMTTEDQQEIMKLAGCVDAEPKAGDCTEDVHKRFRTIDGTCNNLKHPLQGSAGRTFLRLLESEYENGINQPKGWDPKHKYNGDVPLPTAREVSLIVVSSKVFEDDPQHTDMVMQWGQFLDHDITRTPTVATSRVFEDGQSCKLVCENKYPCFPIPIALDDPRLARDQGKCMGNTRSAATCNMPKNMNKYRREQFNAITAYVDAGNVYGNTKEELDRLRDLDSDRGLLKVNSKHKSDTGKAFLPFNPAAACVGGVNCFLAGDGRVDTQPGLSAMHTLWVREHNRIAEALKEKNPKRTSDEIFNEARKIVGAEHQVITYQEWLPKLLGPIGMKTMRGKSYNENIDASITNEFATAAFRLHGLIRPTVPRLNCDDFTEEDDVKLRETFFRPQNILSHGIDGFLCGLYGKPAKLMQAKHMVTHEVVDWLFEMPRMVSLDLAALNIKRGRDHGLPFYNDYREKCGKKWGLERAKTFEDLKMPNNQDKFNIKAGMTNETVAKLKDAYKNVDNVELWPGLLAEEKVSESKVGPTFLCIIVDQFKRLRKGDRFWWQNQDKDNDWQVFTRAQRRTLKKTTLARVLCNNGDAITRIPADVFSTTDADKMVKCDSLDQLNLDKWKF